MSPLYLLIYIFCLFVSIGISIEMVIKKGIKAIPVFIFVFLFAFLAYDCYKKNTDLKYFLKHSYNSNNITEQKCFNKFILEKEKNKLLTFQMFDFERCLNIETENLTIEQIKINKDN